VGDRSRRRDALKTKGLVGLCQREQSKDAPAGETGLYRRARSASASRRPRRRSAIAHIQKTARAVSAGVGDRRPEEGGAVDVMVQGAALWSLWSFGSLRQPGKARALGQAPLRGKATDTAPRAPPLAWLRSLTGTTILAEIDAYIHVLNNGRGEHGDGHCAL
jgi:hypothetical protein